MDILQSDAGFAECIVGFDHHLAAHASSREEYSRFR